MVKRNDKCQRVHKNLQSSISKLHAWHGNWYKLGPYLLYEHMAVAFEQMGKVKGEREREKLIKEGGKRRKERGKERSPVLAPALIHLGCPGDVHTCGLGWNTFYK